MDTERKWLYAMASGIMVFIMILVAMLIFIPVPETGLEHAKYVLSFLLGVASTIVTYFWGSSKGSADKNDILGGRR